MSIWLAIPSARPTDEVNKTINVWRAQGYNIALYLNAEREGLGEIIDADITMYGKYEGYPRAINDLSRLLLEDTDAQWIICAGDDTLPIRRRRRKRSRLNWRRTSTAHWAVVSRLAIVGGRTSRGRDACTQRDLPTLTASAVQPGTGASLCGASIRASICSGRSTGTCMRIRKCKR